MFFFNPETFESCIYSLCTLISFLFYVLILKFILPQYYFNETNEAIKISLPYLKFKTILNLHNAGLDECNLHSVLST